MISLLGGTESPSVVCLGAHPDDIEIGTAGTLLRIAEESPKASFSFVVFTASEVRTKEAIESASDLIGDRVTVSVGAFTDGFLPYRHAAEAKVWLADTIGEADLVFAPCIEDRHQDHRFVGELAWQVFRRATILEYEIPKWEGDRPVANFIVEFDDATLKAKVEHLSTHFDSQHGKPWYDPGVFEAVARLRGIEAGGVFGEAFVARKVVWPIGD